MQRAQSDDEMRHAGLRSNPLILDPVGRCRRRPIRAPKRRTDADPGRFGHCRARPVTGRRRRASERERHHPLCHLRAQPGNARRSRLIAPQPGRTCLAKPLLPPPDHRLGFTGGLHNLRRAVAGCGQQNNLRPPNLLLRAIAISHNRFQGAAIRCAQSDVRSLVHSVDSHTRVRQGIPDTESKR